MNAVVTIAIGNTHREMAELTHPSICAYAERIGAEFVCIDQPKISTTTPHWEKFQLFELLKKYSRVIYFDTDVIIRDDCPNLFDVVPEMQIGAFNEAFYTDRPAQLIYEASKQYNMKVEEWDKRYFNTGVLVLSSRHKFLFRKPELEYASFYEQTYLNLLIAVHKPLVFDLDYRFNRMCCMDRFTGEPRHASYVIHYAGAPNLEQLFSLIQSDLKTWKKSEGVYRYTRNLFVSVHGGMGDQVCAEPTLRFLRKLYPEDRILIGTHFPRLFQHLSEQYNIEVYDHAHLPQVPDTAVFSTNSLPGPETVQWAVVSHLMCHSVDYSSISVLKRVLPALKKTTELVVYPEDVVEISSLLPGDCAKLVAVHPGKHWDSKTLPLEYWQAVIDQLVGVGLTPVVIGQDQPGDPPDFVKGARGTVDVHCPDQGIDLRNMLSLGGLLALLQQLPVLLSNDSAPIHLAGSFDNWICVIPTCKDGSHILPYRHGQVYYKAKELKKRLVLEDIETKPTHLYPTSADIHDIDWSQYLLDPEVVVQEVLDCFS